MKRSIYHTVLVGATLGLLLACKPIPEEQRFIPDDQSRTSGRAVLIEDFSGVKCTNCPNAARVISKAAESHGDRVVIVALHGNDSEMGTPPGSDPAGLFTPDAKAYLEALGTVNSLPIACFNRRPVASNSGKRFSPSYTEWAGLMREVRALPQIYSIALEARVGDTREVAVSCRVTPIEGSTESHALKLQLWLIEDEITAPQLWNGKLHADYKHAHILRQVLNGLSGEEYVLGETYQKTFAISREQVRLEHCAIVAFVSDPQTQEVYEVAKVKL